MRRTQPRCSSRATTWEQARQRAPSPHCEFAHPQGAVRRFRQQGQHLALEVVDPGVGAAQPRIVSAVGSSNSVLARARPGLAFLGVEPVGLSRVHDGQCSLTASSDSGTLMTCTVEGDIGYRELTV